MLETEINDLKEENATLKDEIEANKEEILEKMVDYHSNGMCIDDYNTKTGAYCGEWVGSTIVRMPMWNPVEDEKIDFEWPTQAEWATMSPETQISSIELNSRWGNLGLVKVNLSNE